MRRLLILYMAAGVVLCGCAAAFAAIKATQVVTGLSLPVQVTYAPGDYQRLFVIEQHTGKVKIIKNRAVAATFLTISNLAQGGEQGLLGITFHPQYQTNRKF